MGGTKKTASNTNEILKTTTIKPIASGTDIAPPSSPFPFVIIHQQTINSMKSKKNMKTRLNEGIQQTDHKKLTKIARNKLLVKNFLSKKTQPTDNVQSEPEIPINIHELAAETTQTDVKIDDSRNQPSCSKSQSPLQLLSVLPPPPPLIPITSTAISTTTGTQAFKKAELNANESDKSKALNKMLKSLDIKISGYKNIVPNEEIIVDCSISENVKTKYRAAKISAGPIDFPKSTLYGSGQPPLLPPTPSMRKEDNCNIMDKIHNETAQQQKKDVSIKKDDIQKKIKTKDSNDTKLKQLLESNTDNSGTSMNIEILPLGGGKTLPKVKKPQLSKLQKMQLANSAIDVTKTTKVAGAIKKVTKKKVPAIKTETAVPKNDGDKTKEVSGTSCTASMPVPAPVKQVKKTAKPNATGKSLAVIGAPTSNAETELQDKLLMSIENSTDIKTTVKSTTAVVGSNTPPKNIKKKPTSKEQGTVKPATTKKTPKTARPKANPADKKPTTTKKTASKKTPASTNSNLTGVISKNIGEAATSTTNKDNTSKTTEILLEANKKEIIRASVDNAGIATNSPKKVKQQTKLSKAKCNEEFIKNIPEKNEKKNTTNAHNQNVGGAGENMQATVLEITGTCDKAMNQRTEMQSNATTDDGTNTGNKNKTNEETQKCTDRNYDIDQKVLSVRERLQKKYANAFKFNPKLASTSAAASQPITLEKVIPETSASATDKTDSMDEDRDDNLESTNHSMAADSKTEPDIYDFKTESDSDDNIKMNLLNEAIVKLVKTKEFSDEDDKPLRLAQDPLKNDPNETDGIKIPPPVPDKKPAATKDKKSETKVKDEKKIIKGSPKKPMVSVSVKKKPKLSSSGTETDSDSDGGTPRRRKKKIVFVQKLHRMASLNALAKVQCLYENESRTAHELGLSKTTQIPKMRTIHSSSEDEKDADKKHPKSTKETKKSVETKQEQIDQAAEDSDKSEEEVETKRELRNAPGLRGVGKHWDFNDCSSFESANESDISYKKDEDSKPKSKKRKAQKAKVAPVKVDKKDQHKTDTKSKKVAEKSTNKSKKKKMDEYSGSSDEEKIKKEFTEKPKKNKLALKKYKKHVQHDEYLSTLKGLARKRMASLNASALVAATYEFEGHLDRNLDSECTSYESLDDEKPPIIISSKKHKDTKKDLIDEIKDPKETSRPTSSSVVIVQDTDVTITGVYVNATTGSSQEAYCKMQYRVQSSVTEERLLRPSSIDPPKSYTPLGALSCMRPPGATAAAAAAAAATAGPTAPVGLTGNICDGSQSNLVQPIATHQQQSTPVQPSGLSSTGQSGNLYQQSPTLAHQQHHNSEQQQQQSLISGAGVSVNAGHIYPTNLSMPPSHVVGHHYSTSSPMQQSSNHHHQQYTENTQYPYHSGVNVQGHNIPAAHHHHYSQTAHQSTVLPTQMQHSQQSSRCESPPIQYHHQSVGSGSGGGYQTTGNNNPMAAPPPPHSVSSLSMAGAGGSQSAFCAPNMQQSHHDLTGYYQPAGPLISPHVIAAPPVQLQGTPPGLNSNGNSSGVIKHIATPLDSDPDQQLQQPPQSTSAAESSDSDVLITGGDLATFRYPSSALQGNASNSAAVLQQQQQQQLSVLATAQQQQQQAAAAAAAAAAQNSVYSRSIHQMHYPPTYPPSYYTPYPGDMCYTPSYQPYFPTAKVYQPPPYRRYPSNYYQPGHPQPPPTQGNPSDILYDQHSQSTGGQSSQPPNGSQLVATAGGPQGPPPPQHIDHYSNYYSSYNPGSGGASQCYSRSLQPPPYMEYPQQCPCPMQSCPKNVLTGPLIGSNSSSNNSVNSSSSSNNNNNNNSNNQMSNVNSTEMKLKCTSSSSSLIMSSPSISNSGTSNLMLQNTNNNNIQSHHSNQQNKQMKLSSLQTNKGPVKNSIHSTNHNNNQPTTTSTTTNNNNMKSICSTDSSSSGSSSSININLPATSTNGHHHLCKIEIIEPLKSELKTELITDHHHHSENNTNNNINSNLNNRKNSQYEDIAVEPTSPPTINTYTINEKLIEPEMTISPARGSTGLPTIPADQNEKAATITSAAAANLTGCSSNSNEIIGNNSSSSNIGTTTNSNIGRKARIGKSMIREMMYGAQQSQQQHHQHPHPQVFTQHSTHPSQITTITDTNTSQTQQKNAQILQSVANSTESSSTLTNNSPIRFQATDLPDNIKTEHIKMEEEDIVVILDDDRQEIKTEEPDEIVEVFDDKAESISDDSSIIQDDDQKLLINLTVNDSSSSSSSPPLSRRIKIIEHMSSSKKSPQNGYKSLIKQTQPKPYLCLSRKPEKKDRFGKIIKQSSKNGMRRRKLVLTDQQIKRLKQRKRKLVLIEKKKQEKAKERRDEILANRIKLKQQNHQIFEIDSDSKCKSYELPSTSHKDENDVIEIFDNKDLAALSEQRAENLKTPLDLTIDLVARGYFSEPEIRLQTSSNKTSTESTPSTVIGRKIKKTISNEVRSKSESKGSFVMVSVSGENSASVSLSKANPNAIRKTLPTLSIQQSKKSKQKDNDVYITNNNSIQKSDKKKSKKSSKSLKSLKSSKNTTKEQIPNLNQVMKRSTLNVPELKVTSILSTPASLQTVTDAINDIHLYEVNATTIHTLSIETNNNNLDHTKLQNGGDLNIQQVPNSDTSSTVTDDTVADILNNNKDETKIMKTDHLNFGIEQQSSVDLRMQLGGDSCATPPLPTFSSPPHHYNPQQSSHILTSFNQQQHLPYNGHHPQKRKAPRSRFGCKKRPKRQLQPNDLGETVIMPRKANAVPKWNNGWSWEGESFKGKVFLNSDDPLTLRTCYPAMRHSEGDIIRPRDCVLLRAGTKKNELPYVAKVAHLWENPEDGEMMMSLLWYYRPEHTEQGRQLIDCPDEVFASRHRDHNSVACIEDKCYVLTFAEYNRYRRYVRAIEEGVYPLINIVPPLQEVSGLRSVPPHTNPEQVMFCTRVYEFRLKRLMKENQLKLVIT